jgi:hypothetical protein
MLPSLNAAVRHEGTWGGYHWQCPPRPAGVIQGVPLQIQQLEAGGALPHALPGSYESAIAKQWMSNSLLHESSDWQELLDEFNQSGFCT